MFTGDAYPDLPKDGKLHLLSMRFCPFAQRIHLVLAAKQIPYHTINVNLTEKPQWITKYSPLGKVPALGLTNETGTPYIYESLVVADYLDEKFPQAPLYPKDPLQKTLDRLWVEQFNDVIKVYYQILFGKDALTAELLTPIADGLYKFEEELQRRGTVFFGGDKPGMLDYMIWPWCERFAVYKLSANFEFDKTKFAKFVCSSIDFFFIYLCQLIIIYFVFNRQIGTKI